MKISIKNPQERFAKFIEIPNLAIPFKYNPKADKLPGNCHACPLHFGNYYKPLHNEINPDAVLLFVDRNPIQKDMEAGRRHSTISPVGVMFESYLKELAVQRSEISISTVIHCNLPPNKVPNPEYIRVCSQWKSYELGMMPNLKFIFLLGDFPVRQFLGWDRSLIKFYGVNYYTENPHPIYVFPVLAPGHVMIEPHNKDLVFQQLRFIRENCLDKYRKDKPKDTKSWQMF